MQVMAMENISGGFHGNYGLCSSWLTFWIGSSLRGTSLQWKMKMTVPLKIRTLFCMCLIPDCRYWTCKLSFIHTHSNTLTHVNMYKSIYFDGNPESVFLKTTDLWLFIIMYTGYWNIISFYFFHPNIYVTKEIFLLLRKHFCLFSTNCLCCLPYFVHRFHFHFSRCSTHPVFYYNFWYDILDLSLLSLIKSILLQVAGILPEKKKKKAVAIVLWLKRNKQI